MKSIQDQIQKAIQGLFGVTVSMELTRPDPQFGDYATNIALVLSKQLGTAPRDIAEKLIKGLSPLLEDMVLEMTIAGPGFINFRLKDDILLEQFKQSTHLEKPLSGQTIVAEYSDPNPFKILHAGHLYTSVVGDSIANILESAGANVHRVNFGGDVGLHVSKTLYVILQRLKGENPEGLERISDEDRSTWLAECYVEGTNAYEEDTQAKEQITQLNKRVYQLHAKEDKSSPFAQIYWTTRKWSYDYFDQFYSRIGTIFEKYYPESDVAELGLTKVKEHIREGVFEESEGAIVFKGEPYGLHTRVFINQEGLPTYEAKDVGLIFKKYQDYSFNTSVVITGNEQEQYMQVVLKAIEQFAPELVSSTKHLTHGLVKLRGGAKMSSRKGNILRAVDVLDIAAQANSKMNNQADESVTLGAVKYSFLKVRTGGDIIYDPEESVSLEGNSGPYLQYAHARARSILNKATVTKASVISLASDERTLVAKIVVYPEVVAKATEALMPHLICTYLYELSQEFNRFYEHNRVIGDPRQAERMAIVEKYADVLHSGLGLLGIFAPEKM